MKRKAIGGGAYHGEDGKFYARPWINGRRTWRKLKSVKPRNAIKEANRSVWKSSGDAFGVMAQLYEQAGYPNRRLESRNGSFAAAEGDRIIDLVEYFGRFRCDEIRLAQLPAYKLWRVKRCKRGTGERTVDQDLVTLSNVLNYAVGLGKLDVNYIRSGRPRFRKMADVRHSREVAPPDAETIHKLAQYFFDSIRSETLGWLLLFCEFTGCRIGELLKLRLDAKDETEPGFIADQYLYLRRSKGGVNPWAIIGPEFADMLKAFLSWHAERYPKSKWFFPSFRASTKQHLDCCALGHALTRACRKLKVKHFTPHGMRSFYVTKRRSDGASDVVIAGEIGDKTSALMEMSYGSRPPNWSGGKAIAWMPKRKPVWTGLFRD